MAGSYIDIKQIPGFQDNCYIQPNVTPKNKRKPVGAYLETNESAQISDEEILKAAIQSMSVGQLKETVFQFITSVKGLSDKFFTFINKVSLYISCHFHSNSKFL